MDFKVKYIKKACELRNISYVDLMKSLGLEYYANFDLYSCFIELLDYDKIKISKKLNTVIAYFYGLIEDKLLLDNKLTLEEYENAVNSDTLEKYFISLGLENKLKTSSVIEIDNEYFKVNDENLITTAELNSAIAFINKDKSHILNMDKLPAFEEVYINLVRMHPLTLKDLKFQTEDICITAVSKFAHAIEYVETQTEKIAITAVAKNGLVLEYVDPKFHNERIVKAALKQNPLAFKFSHLKTYDICLMAVRGNGINYEFIPEEFRTHEMKLEALNSNGWAIKFFDKQTEEYALKAILQNTETCLCIDEEIRENNDIIKLIYPEVVKKHSFFTENDNFNI